MYLYYVYHLFFHVVLLSLGSCDPANLTSINDACICPGSTLRLNCTTVGDGITTWDGTVFDQITACDSLSLPHNQFSTPGFSRFCPDNSVLARPLSIVDNCYNSQLTLNISVDLNGSTIVCEHDSLSGGPATPVGTYPIVLTTGRERERDKLCFLLTFIETFLLTN